MNDLVEISKKILSDCLGVKPGEKFLVVTDDYEEELASYLYKAGKKLGLVSMLFKILPLSISGEERPLAVAEAMKNVDVAICITQKSLTHRRLKKKQLKQA